MKHGSLFSGIGGFDFAAAWMGWDNVFHCEWNDFGRKVLHYYWPDAIQYGDITKTDFTIHWGQIDILTGGFPCQPYSAAGKRKGKEDERHLWPEMLRAIREISPRWIVGENVRGLTNWNGGMVFDEVQADLESEGYEVLPFLLPAAAVNAPHRRDRIWFVAHADSICNSGVSERQRHPYQQTWSSKANQENRDERQQQFVCNIASQRIVANAHLHGRNECNCNDEVNASEGRQYAQRDVGQSDEHGNIAKAQMSGSARQCECKPRQIQPNGRNSRTIPTDWQNFPTQSPICGGDDGLPSKLDGITFSKWRAESIKGYGNAIVPQVAMQIFRAIEAYERL